MHLLNLQMQMVKVTREVNFYLNGTYIGSDIKPPYNINFQPDSFSDDNPQFSTTGTFCSRSIMDLP